MSEDIEAAEKLQKATQTIRDEISKVIVGQKEVIDQIMIA
ncbi:MAG: AAA family ATPase, partial [Lentisphaeria bacterium]|nr:AAA family ATPase [Lentisphaeria bacterium]